MNSQVHDFMLPWITKNQQQCTLQEDIADHNASWPFVVLKSEEKPWLMQETSPHTEYKDSSLWCKRCIAMLDFEGLDQKVLFAAIEFNDVSYS